MIINYRGAVTPYRLTVHDFSITLNDTALNRVVVQQQDIAQKPQSVLLFLHIESLSKYFFFTILEMFLVLEFLEGASQESKAIFLLL